MNKLWKHQESSRAHFSSTNTKTGTTHRKLAWPLHQDDMQIHEDSSLTKGRWYSYHKLNKFCKVSV